ncbi:MAG TPA: hypothetical protein VGI95_08735 [Caulobacteraceae bacterium]|jgi:hypothetical protein
MASASDLERGAPSGVGPVGRALARLSPREAWLLTAMILVAIGVAAFYAFQWSSSARDRFVAAQVDVALARQSAAAVRRHGADDGSQAQLQLAQGWSTHARTLWLARLAIEQRLSAAALAAHLPSPQIKVAEGLETGTSIPELKAEVSGPYLPGPWLDFMRGIAGSGPAFVVDKLDVSDAGAAQYDLTLLVPVSLDEPPPAAAEPSS